jgi:hypothetical protein
LLVLISTIAIVSCATVPPLRTATGKAEVTISGVTKKQVIDGITYRMVLKGFQVKSTSDYMVVVGKKTENAAALILLGSRWDPTPEERIAFNIVEVGPGVRVIANIMYVTNPGSGFERVTDTSTQSKYAHELNDMLDKLKASLEFEPKIDGSSSGKEPSPAQATKDKAIMEEARPKRDPIEQIKELDLLKRQGKITQDEYRKLKTKIINGE